ncbi:DUF3144 domain-containing protein [Agarilytica rhodophyticola]|uniref:DUF3144 domain-containing protein n=1 Tax=Agarilytica rhodophyticola TaxID=1737490 RepID=UPI000B341195|nr:DUF3144 domain-containing protein [Agarilytica rhodophyticola]
MTNQTSDQDRYWQLVESIIHLANDNSEGVDIGIVASALMQASSRFAAFYVANSSASRKDLKEDKDELIRDMTREFKRQFAENLEDYIENYKVYLAEPEE